MLIFSDLDPDFKAYPQEQTIEGPEAFIKIPCRPPASNPPAKINWYKDGKLIEVCFVLKFMASPRSLES